MFKSAITRVRNAAKRNSWNRFWARCYAQRYANQSGEPYGIYAVRNGRAFHFGKLSSINQREREYGQRCDFREIILPVR